MENIIGIIGGSGLDNPAFFSVEKTWVPRTCYGEPSSPLRQGRIGGVGVVLLSRHGTAHTLTPSGINYRANLAALKEAGCTRILASAACGSLREEIAPGSIVVPNQFIDFTRQRANTFFETFAPGIENARHTAMADPFDAAMRAVLLECGRQNHIAVMDGATLVTIEGPRFSTRAESRMFRSWGADLVNMTIATEAILANELAIPYAIAAMVTDYDSWNAQTPPLVVEEMLRVFSSNVSKLTRLLLTAIPRIGAAQ